MRAIPLATSLCLLASGAAAQQELLHYKFDSGCTTEVINYATGPMVHAQPGLLESTSPLSPWVPGVFGQALAGGSTLAPTY